MAESECALSPDKLSEMRAIFLWLDTEKKTYINAGVLESFLLSWRKIISPDEVRELVNQSDVKRTGRISFKEFMGIILEFDKMFKIELQKELNSTFKKIDDKRTGYIRVEDLLTVFKSNEFSVSIDYVKETIQKVNPSEDQNVKYEDFIETFII